MPSSASSGIGAERTQDELDALFRSHGVVVTEGFTVSLAEEDRYVSSPPPAGAVCVHVYALKAGLCCKPRQNFLNAVLTHFGVAPSQLAPNSWLIMGGFVGLCHSLGVEPSVAVFRRFFVILPLNYGCESRYYAFRKRIRDRPVFTNLLISMATFMWKEEFFLLWSPVPWACPVVWGKPSDSSRAGVDFMQLAEGERSAERKLFEAIDHGPLDINVYIDSAMTPPKPSPRTNAISAQGTDPAANAMAWTEKGTAVVQASAADGISSLLGKKRNREEAHTVGPLRLDLRRVFPPGFSAPDMNVAGREVTSTALLDIQPGKKEKVLAQVRQLLDEADALRDGEMKKTKAQLSEAKESAKLQKENADALREELKMTKAQLSKAYEVAKLEKQKANALREELKKTKAQLSKANEVAKLEKQNADALREELKKMKAQAKVAMKELMKISDL